MSQNGPAVDRNAVYRRHNGQRGPARQRILIVCEGKKTEPAYFRAFHLSNVTIEGVGMNTQSLVQRAVELRDAALRERRGYDAIWCVFDRDSFPADVFNQALALAQRNNFGVTYSNEAFELWYLLHFHYYQHASSRKQYEHLLSTLLTHPYQKIARRCTMSYCQGKKPPFETRKNYWL